MTEHAPTPPHPERPTGGRLASPVGRRGRPRVSTAPRLLTRIMPELPRLVAVALGPVLAVQGGAALARVPRLPEAAGPRSGSVGGVAEDALTLLVVGESTAVGVGVDTHEEGIAAVLARRVHEVCAEPVRWSVVGRNGARLRANDRRRLPRISGEFDCAVVVLGVNDTLGLTSPRRWRAEMETLLATLRQGLAEGGLLVLAGVPQLHRFPALPRPLRTVMGLHGRALDAVLAQLARENVDVVHVPTPAMTSRADLAADGFHPSAVGYRRWGELLADTALVPWRERLTAAGCGTPRAGRRPHEA